MIDEKFWENLNKNVAFLCEAIKQANQELSLRHAAQNLRRTLVAAGHSATPAQAESHGDKTPSA